MLRRQDAMEVKELISCHGGKGIIRSRRVLLKEDSELGIQFMHDDIIQPGDSVGEHLHDDSEELYFIVSGEGTMIIDHKEVSIKAGDVSLVRRGHSHGIKNTSDRPMRLLVVEVKEKR